MEKVHNISSILIGELRNNKFNQNFTFMVSISAYLLTISALVTIFILLNKQHIIQKCKELTWDIEDIINGNGKAYN
ncbi:hypothetical protein [Paenibacillus sp. 1-18]|uniref:hypothetical protein n=1 Tax=Paenibacillus sp. 1-18 TaxID=1333846 RepID=UPI000471B645|nr:hypothetical protein [Paenibacillus sp. 1-18]